MPVSRVVCLRGFCHKRAWLLLSWDGTADLCQEVFSLCLHVHGRSEMLAMVTVGLVSGSVCVIIDAGGEVMVVVDGVPRSPPAVLPLIMLRGPGTCGGHPMRR